VESKRRPSEGLLGIFFGILVSISNVDTVYKFSKEFREQAEHHPRLAPLAQLALETRPLFLS